MKIASAVAMAISFTTLAAQADRRGGEEGRGKPVACSDLTAYRSEGNTTITSATLVTSGSVTVTTPNGVATTYTNLPAFCRVIGVSRPTSDSNINFEAWLPTSATWNGKFLSNGEGGYVGVIGYAGIALYLQRGYATVSTDTGHVNTDLWWAVGHRERAIDYLYRAKHLTTIATKGLIKTFYGKAASYNYFQSCSNGGRQGWLEIQRYPDDFDGLIVGAPWNFQSHSNAGFVWDGQALSAPGAAIPVAKLPNITAAVQAACDADDGLADGIVTNPLTCKFNPDTLLCAGAETDSCLTAPQLAALKKIYAGPSNSRTGRRIFPGFAVGSERQWTALVVNFRATGLGTGYFGNLTFEDPNWDYSKFNFDSDMAYADFKVGTLGNAIDTDLREARERGVKIIQYHGWEDQTLQPAYSPQWYAQVARANGGLEKTQDFYRLFMIPGMRHCSGGPGAWVVGQGTGQQPLVRDDLHDIQTAIESWVEHGKAPSKFIATKFTTDDVTATTVQFTRPLCAHPKIARYKGGDPNAASSFVCVGARGNGGDDDGGDDDD
jgi:feruloyl esterase